MHRWYLTRVYSIISRSLVPSDCLLIPRPYLSGKIASPSPARSKAQWNRRTGRNRTEPFHLFISPPRSPTAISSGAVSSIQFILQRESTRRVYIYIPFRIIIKSLPSIVLSIFLSHDVNPISPSRMRFLEREILTDKKGLMNRSRSGTTRSCCSEYT